MDSRWLRPSWLTCCHGMMEGLYVLSWNWGSSRNEWSDFMSEAEMIRHGICPSCSGTLTFQEGCKVCYSCSWGGCS